MSTELKIVDSSALSEQERTELETNIDALIAAHKNNRQAINRLVFESVAAMTAGEDYERQLANKKGLRRFLGGITGSNKKLQDKINSSRAAAQYASQQTLQKLAEQNLMSFDLITAINNKLNASVIAVEGEINQIYAALLTFFKQSRSDMTQLAVRIDRLEQNVNLLNWKNSIEYQMFNGTEYAELNDTDKIVCLARDFYDITQGQWSTSDLLLLKSTMSAVDISPKNRIGYLTLILNIAGSQVLRNKLLGLDEIIEIQDPENVVMLGGIRKGILLEGDESYIVTAAQETLSTNGVHKTEKEIVGQLVSQYLKKTASVNPKASVPAFDIVLELLYNLQQVRIKVAENILPADSLEQNNLSAENSLPVEDNSENSDDLKAEEDAWIPYNEEIADGIFTSGAIKSVPKYVLETEHYYVMNPLDQVAEDYLIYVNKGTGEVCRLENVPEITCGAQICGKYGGSADTIIVSGNGYLFLWNIAHEAIEEIAVKTSVWPHFFCAEAAFVAYTYDGDPALYVYNGETRQTIQIAPPFEEGAGYFCGAIENDYLYLYSPYDTKTWYPSEYVLTKVNLKQRGKIESRDRLRLNAEYAREYSKMFIQRGNLYLYSDCEQSEGCFEKINLTTRHSTERLEMTRSYIVTSWDFYKNFVIYGCGTKDDTGIKGFNLKTGETVSFVPGNVDWISKLYPRTTESAYVRLGDYIYFRHASNKQVYKVNINEPGIIQGLLP